ncbi:carbamate kinase [Paucidesulfovibrio longus]|uniref:carbamate kinase n=1 Tax=Paucidesulfovibrio longus TaxID=889 RepID=UPI0003B45D2A|nr:carbamate kinase [Paucidesulfovibrio longus]
MTPRNKPILLVALGGNALIRKGQEGSIRQQFENLRLPMRQIAGLSLDWRVIITHGNGPQVGDLLLQQECCDKVPKLPLEILVAQTEGQIGYMIESTLDQALSELNVAYRPLVSMLTYVVVDRDDPALREPTKPIGPVLAPPEAAEPVAGYPVRNTAKGWRRVVGSPEPVTIVERREIGQLVDLDFIVICCGGGGIPVIREGRGFNGVDAVIDKDLASSLLAREVGADLLVMATDVEGAMIHYGKPEQQVLGEITIHELSKRMEEGHFPAGSMLPKVRAGRRFALATGKTAVICSIENIEEAVSGRAGTRIVTG